MRITEADIEDFRALWQQTFAESISAEKAQGEIQRLLDAILLLAQERRNTLT